MAKSKKGTTIHLRGAAAQRFIDAAMRDSGQDAPTRKADAATETREKICIGCGARVKEGDVPACGH